MANPRQIRFSHHEGAEAIDPRSWAEALFQTVKAGLLEEFASRGRALLCKAREPLLVDEEMDWLRRTLAPVEGCLFHFEAEPLSVGRTCGKLASP